MRDINLTVYDREEISIEYAGRENLLFYESKNNEIEITGLLVGLENLAVNGVEGIILNGVNRLKVQELVRGKDYDFGVEVIERMVLSLEVAK